MSMTGKTKPGMEKPKQPGQDQSKGSQHEQQQGRQGQLGGKELPQKPSHPQDKK